MAFEVIEPESPTFVKNNNAKRKMDVHFNYGNEDLWLKVPDKSQIYVSEYDECETEASELLLHSVSHPEGCLPLRLLLRQRRQGKVVIVVSDITRPIPYYSFLPALLKKLEDEGINQEEITIIVATGMHRASTQKEKLHMFGETIVRQYAIIDHDAENEAELAYVEGTSWSGTEVRLNRHYVEAGFRILTGLVEPHFMAGFSGGRKSICPGLSSLSAIRMFHGYSFLANPNTANTILQGNPCHMENTSVARLCPADFSVNIVLNQHKKVNRIISGDTFISHEATIRYLKNRCYKKVVRHADVALTSCGGYPLDNTFYQCVKGFVNCLPAIKPQGSIIAFGSCSEGTGSPEYESLIKQYAFNPDDFLEAIQNGRFFIKDQWQFQMHIRVLKHIGKEHLHFYTAAIPQEELRLLSVQGHSIPVESLRNTIQSHIDREIEAGKSIAVFPEGPYCSPVS